MQIDPEPDASNRGTKRTAIQADIVADETGGPDAYHIYLDSFVNGAAGSSHFFGAGQVGAPGVTQYPNWKPPPPCTAKHNKTFYLELENTNFTYGDQGLLAPYYAFPWQYIPFYLHPGEYKWYSQNTNFAKIKSVRFQVNVIGARLPFTTNDETASVANSQVDQMLDVYRSMEKLYPFILYDTKNTTDLILPSQFHAIVKRLYGQVTADTGATEVSAVQGYRRWHVQPLFPKGVGSSALASTYPAFAHNKIMSADLRSFRGPLCEMSHRCKNGIIVVAQSVVPLLNRLAADNFKTYSSPLYKHPQVFREYAEAVEDPQNAEGDDDSCLVYRYTDALVQKFTVPVAPATTPPSSVTVHQSTHNSLRSNSSFAIRQPKLLPGMPAGLSDYMDGYHGTIEGNSWTTGSEFNLHNFQSFFMGVRPQMNGSKYQQGITQVEIKTEIEVEYSVFWPNPTVLPDDPKAFFGNGSQDQLGLTNDIDLAHNFPGWQQPGYTHHHKQPWLDLGQFPTNTLQ